jgi:FkbM family methyltransferase
MIVANGTHEPNEMAFMTRVLRSGDDFVDVGANVGIYSTILGRAGARVIAFEPDSNTRRVLEANLAANCLLGGGRALPYALADWDGIGRFSSGQDVGSHLETEMGQQTSVAVSVARLDSLVATGIVDLYSPPALLFMKIDAEGADLKVLRGATSVVTAHTPVILVEVWEGGNAIRSYLEGLGYRVYHYSESRRYLGEYPKTFSGQTNFIALHPRHLEQILSRLSQSGDVAMLRPQIVRWSGE